MSRVQTPVIPVVADLIRRHPGTISLGQGVVYYGPPPEAEAAMREGLLAPDIHKYKPVTGMPALVDAWAAKLRHENGLETGKRSRLVVTAGGNLAFYNAILAVADEGDEVILPLPYYFNHEMAIVMAHARPVLAPTGPDYHLLPDRLRALVTPKTRAIVTVSPNNPTGAVYREEELRAVNELCREKGLFHIHDEAYEYFAWDGMKVVSPGGFEGAEDHTISLYSLSKAYGFASWRIGFMTMPADLLEPVRKIQDTLLICAPAVSQLAALGALRAGRAYCEARSQMIAGNRSLLRQKLRRLEGKLEFNEPEGAFYVMVRLPGTRSSMACVERLVEQAGVAVIPGSAFGLEKECALRVAYGALETREAGEAFDRLVNGLERLLGEN
ncbi:MAG: pyridoxal phosphate-dependent aminotransferase [Verrucomicrobia bacterium]|nr:pyridoxal phosphate-dependent aminotransferase [Verrucomicrobiota bacterium]